MNWNAFLICPSPNELYLHAPFIEPKPPSPPPVPVLPNALAQSTSSEPIPSIDALYSPTFALEEVRQFVMEALAEAVEINQVHNRDPIGGSNENLFL